MDVAEEEERPPKEDAEGIEDAEVETDAPTAGSTLGNEPPERKEGHSERSSGSEAGCLPMKDRIAAAFEGLMKKIMEKKKKVLTYLEQLNLLMFAQYKLGCFSPLTSMFPTMLVKTVWMAVYLEIKILLLILNICICPRGK